MKKMKRFLSVLLCTFLLVGLLPVSVSAGPGDPPAPPHEHPLVKTERNEPASCSETGNKEYWTCETCDKYFGDKDGKKEIEENSWIITGKHSLEKTNEIRVDACTKTGNTAYWTCDTCSKFFKDKDGKNEIEEGSWITTGPHKAKKEHAAKAATCTESGNIKYWSCDDCGKYFSDKDCKNEISEADVVIPAQHTLTEHAANDATCTEPGNIKYWSCSGGCGKYFSDEGVTEIEENQWVIAAQHTLTETVAQTPTCAADGNHAYWTCSGGCGKYFSNAEATAEYQLNEWVIPAVDHDYGNWITSDEQHWKECSFGHESEKAPHVYDDDADAFCNDCNYEREIEEEPEEEFEINVSVDCPEIGDGLDALNVAVTNAKIEKIEFEPKGNSKFAEGENKVKIVLIPAEGETFAADAVSKVAVNCAEGVTVRTTPDGKPEIKLERDGKLTIKLLVNLEEAEDPNDPPVNPDPDPNPNPNPDPEPTEFEVTFNSNGGTKVDKQTVESGKTATKPADPTKTEGDHNLRFLGWYENGSTTAYDFSSPVTAKVELEAKWIKVHDVTFYAADGETVLTVLTVDEGTTVSADDVAATGYEGSDTWYKMNKKGEATAEQYDFTKPVKGCTDLIGDWTLINYTITYDLGGGAVATENPTTYTIKSDAITLNNPTRDGYIFDGWTGSNGTTPEKTVTIAAGSTGNKTYTANWTRVIVYYTVSYDANGGTGTMTSAEVQANTAYELSANGFTAPSGKVFKCWKVGDTEYKAGEDIIVTSDVTVKAVWKSKATGLDYVPASGDNFPILLWAGLLLFSAVALTEVVLLHRKRR